MSKDYRYYIHSQVSVYITDDFDTAYTKACYLSLSGEFMFFYDSETDTIIPHIDSLTAYNENTKV